jgi:hypothetical protein
VRKKWWLSFLLIIFMLPCFGLGIVLAKNKHGKGHGKDGDGDPHHEESRYRDPALTENERVVVGRWYHEAHGLPPGLAKRDRLPPGLEKHLIRGGTLPPGLQKKIQPLPIVIERQLTVLPVGYRRGYIGGHIVILNDRTSLVLDVMRLIP